MGQSGEPLPIHLNLLVQPPLIVLQVDPIWVDEGHLVAIGYMCQGEEVAEDFGRDIFS